MKKLLSLSILLFNLPVLAAPLTFELNSLINSNIDRVSNPVKTDVYSQKLLLKSKLKFKPKKRMILIDLPSIDLEYTPSLTEKVRNLNISNTLIGLYLPKRGLIYNGTFSLGYSKSIFTNEDQEIENSRNWSVGADAGVTKDLTKKYSLGGSLGAKVQTYLEPANPNDVLPLKDDNLRLNAKITQKYKINKPSQLGLNLSFQNKIYKEKRALNARGDQVSTLAETIYNYKINTYYSLKMKEFRLIPDIGYALNVDDVEDGRSYKGLEYKLNFSYYFKYLIFTSRISYKIRDYKTQLVDTVDTSGASPLLEARIVGFNNTIEVPFGKQRQYQFLTGYNHQGLKSNRKSDDNSNQIYKLGLRLNF